MPKTAPAPGSGAPSVGRSVDDRSDARRRVALIVGVTVAIATFGVWIYALFIYDPGLKIDELADRRFPEAAESVCVAVMAQVDELPAANESATAAERADVVDQANALMVGMVDELDTLAPTDGDPTEREAIGEWVSDWRDHVTDRQEYVNELREDPEARFSERVKGTKQLSRAIDSFAEVNRMESCSTPGDVG